MKKCEICGTQCEDTESVCGHCGSPLPDVNPIVNNAPINNVPVNNMAGNVNAQQGVSISSDMLVKQPANDYGQQPANDYGQQPVNDYGQQPANDYGQKVDIYGQPVNQQVMNNDYGQMNNNMYGQVNNNFGQNNVAQSNNYNTYTANNMNNNMMAYGNSYGIQLRSIPLAILFTFLTCGIYAYYWIAKINDELNQLTGDEQGTSGGMVVLLSIVTCGIYALYWYYKSGEKVDRIQGNPDTSSTSALYLILAIFGLGLVDLGLMQDTINKAI